MKKNKRRINNSSKNFNKSIIRRNIVTLSTSFALLIVALIATILVLNPHTDEKKFMAYEGYYDSDQNVIASSTPTDEYIKMEKMYNISGGTVSVNPNAPSVGQNQYISIESLNDFYAFDKLCNSNSTTFGTYKYILLKDLDWSTYGSFFEPIDSFSGELNGNGYVVKNILFKAADGTLSTNFAMFKTIAVGGSVHHLGIINPRITINALPQENLDVYIANLCAVNRGTINYVFVRDGYEDVAKTGNLGLDVLTSGYYISGMVGQNYGTFTNSYYVGKKVFSSTSITVSSFQEVLNENNGGTISNLFFFDNQIKNYTNNGATIEYSELNKTYNYTTHYGTYCESLDDLNDAVPQASADWINSSYYDGYGNFGSLFDFRTPIIGKITASKLNYDTTNNKYEITIASSDDYNYIFNQMNINAKFSDGSMVYKLASDINLNDVAVPSYDDVIQSTFTSASTASASDIKTIYLSNYNYYVSTGTYEAYGVFPYFSGNLSYINFVISNGANAVSITSTSSRPKAIGGAVGYSEGATIDNVNVYTNLTYDNQINKYFVGGIVGVSGAESTISNSTATGSIVNTNSTHQSFSEITGMVNGVAIGGCIGYVEKTGSSVSTLLSCVNITTAGYTSKDVMVGGVIGAAYLMNSEKLQNKGTISVGTNGTAAAYNRIYVAGVIGRLLGMFSQSNLITNNGDITLYQASNNATYLSGIINADIDTTSPGKYALKQKGKYQFWASCLSNGANISLKNSNSNANVYYTYGLFINNNNEFITKLSGVYNLNYRFEEPSIALGSMTIDMYQISRFAPVIITNNTTNANYYTNLSIVYNLRDTDYSLSAAITSAKTLYYTGCVYGSYINYIDVRNEGNQIFSMNKGISTQSTLYVSGVFHTLTNGFTAKSIYNGGNITINEPNGSNAEKKLNMYLSGICYQNASVDDDTHQNPLSTTFDKSLVGTMNNVINSGKITVSSYYLNKTTDIDNTPATKPYYNSNIYIGGITNINNGIISNTFNLGDIDISIYSYAAGKHYEAGGIAYVMNGEYAQIRDSANNGDITIIDTIKRGTTTYVNIGGIVARNDGSTNNNKQVISFTINYGTLHSFQPSDNMIEVSVGGAHATCGGIIGIGICNLVNVVNYGIVYSSDCAAGIISIANLASFSSSNTINVANTINYGQVKINPTYYANDIQAINYQTYNTIISKAYVENGDPSIRHTYAGAISTIFNFNSQTNIKIRFLINLCKEATTITTSLNPATTDTSTFTTAHSASDYFGNSLIKYAPLSTINDGENIGAFNENFVFYKAIKGEGLDTSNYVTDLYISDFFEFVLFDKVNPLLLDKIGWTTIAYSNAAENLFKNIEALKTLVNISRTGSSSTDSATLLANAFTNNTWIETMDKDLLNSLLDNVLDKNNTDGLSNYHEILQYVLLDSTANSAYTQAIRTTVVNKIIEYYEENTDLDYYELLQTLLYDVLLAKVVSSDNADYANVLSSIRTTLQNSTDLSGVFDAYITELRTNTNLLNDLFDNVSTKSYYEDSKIALLNTLLQGYDQITLQEIYEKLYGDLDSSINYKLFLQENPTEAKNVYIGLITYNSFSDALGSSYLSWINEYTNKYNLTTVLNDEKAIDATFSKASTDDFADISSLSGYKYTPLNGTQNDTSQDSVTVASQTKTIQNFTPQNITSLMVTPSKDYSSLWNIIKNDSGIQNIISSYFESIKDPTSGITYNGLYAMATEYNNTYQSNDRSQYQYNIPIDYHGGISIGGSSGRDYYGNTAFGSYTKNGVTTNLGNLAIKTRFIYVPDDVVSYQTNYFGPYIAANGTNKGKVYDADGNLIANNANYNIGVPVNAAINNGGSGDTKRSMVPVFIGLDDDFVHQKIAESNTTSTNDTTYVFLWNDSTSASDTGFSNNSDYMWKSISFISNKGSNSEPANNSYGYIYNLYRNGQVISDTNNYIEYGYDFSPIGYKTSANPFETITKHNDANYYQNLPTANNKRFINDTTYKHTYSDYYLRAYVTSSILTGIFMTHSTWIKGGQHISLHSKNETNYAFGNSTGYYGVHTTSFIGYKMSDLVKLDGVRTKGHCANDVNNLDEDEINIISAICEKILETTAGKEAVLKAIAEYAKDHNFTTNDSAVVRMLMLAIQDTDFAKEIVTSGINDIVDLNYSNTQTIGQYLDSRGANSLTDYKDLIISKSVNNKGNFADVLLETLANYSEKAKLYSDYYDYTRSAISEYLYDYIKYRIDNGEKDWTDFDSIFASVSDTDLSSIKALLDVSSTSIRLNDYTYEAEYMNFIIDDAILYNSDDSSFNVYNQNNPGYSRVLVGNTNYNSTTGDGSYIEFTTGNYNGGYVLTVVYEGTLNLVGNNITTTQTYTDNGSGATTYSFTGLEKNTTYRLYFNYNTEIYDVLSLESTAHTGAGQTNYTAATSPFVTYVDNSAVQYGQSFIYITAANDSKYRVFGNAYKGTSNSDGNFDALLNYTLNKGSNIEYNSVNVSFGVLFFDPDNYETIFKLNNNVINSTVTRNNTPVTITEYKTPRDYYIYTYSLSINPSDLNDSNNISIEIISEGTSGGNDKKANIIFGNLCFDYNFDFENDLLGHASNCVFHQNVHASYADNTGNGYVPDAYKIVYYSHLTLNNNNNNLGVVVSGGASGSKTFSTTQPTYTIESTNPAPINSAVVFTPWYYDSTYNQGQIFTDKLYLSYIPINVTTIESNLNQYFDLISDVGKYIIKDIFVKQTNNSFDLDNDSYVEFRAKGNGTIKIYYFDDTKSSLSEYSSSTPVETIFINSSTNRYYEAVLQGGSYVFTFSCVYTTDGSLYTYDSTNDIYTAVTSGAYDSTKTYYVKSENSYYEALVENKILFNTTGSLYTYDSTNELYIAVTSGSYDSTETYYLSNGTGYDAVSVTDNNVIVDSLYTTLVGGYFTLTTNSSTGINTLRYNIDDTRDLLIRFDYSTISSYNFNNSHLAQYNSDNGTSFDKYQLFYTIYPYYRSVAGKTNTELRNNDIFETMITLMATIKQDSDNPTYFTLFADSKYTDAALLALIRLLALVDYTGTDSVLDKLISTTYFNPTSSSSTNYCEKLLEYLCDETTGIDEIKINVAKYIWSQANTNHSSALADYIYGAYLGNNYLANTNLKTETYMYTLLNNFTAPGKEQGYYQFILTNTTVDSSKVAELIALLTSNSEFELGGYGIYALASSQGKQQGQFIPDNLELDYMDTYYEVSSVGYSLVDGEDSDASWRGGITDDEDCTDDHSSVNYAFYCEMKQLIKSISTTVFTLTLVDKASGTINYYGDVNLDEKTVTFYVSDADDVLGNYKVSVIDLAYKAEAYDGALSTYNSSATKFEVGTQLQVVNPDVVSRQFTVFAEDRTVHKVYSIIFKVLKPSFDLEYSDHTTSKTVSSSTENTSVVVNLTSASTNPNTSNYTDYLPIGLNLKPYISINKIVNGSVDTSYDMSSEYVDLSTRTWDHIVTPVYTGNRITGSKSTITLDISYKLPAGTYRITVSVCGYTAYVTYIKEASNLHVIEAYFDGGTTNIFSSSNTVTSEIPFGRLYNNIELTDYERKYEDYGYEFYLDRFIYSDNATLEVTLTREEIDGVILDSVVLYTKYKYTIVYHIIAENGEDDATYTHILVEKDPYANGDIYASVTKDGDVVNPYSSGTTYYNQDATVTENNVVSIKYDTTTESLARVQFNRSESNGELNEPKYKIIYDMSNIYTISTNKSFTATEVTADENIINTAALKPVYDGLSVKLSYLCETGVYRFRYSYSNTGDWDIVLDADGNIVSKTTYSQTYNFPEFQIEKKFSLDATLHQITFIDSYKGISASATAMTVEPMRPVEGTQEKPLAENEKYYANILDNNANWEISLAGSQILYDYSGTDYSSMNYSDYYIVGSVANAQLKNYAPTFEIEEHAMIFQYITTRIRTGYGKGLQGNYTDAQVLEDHSTTTYLYVPFTHIENGNVVQDVFLVELATNGKTLTNVYVAKTFTATGASINKTIYDISTTNVAIKFSYEGVEYTLNRAAFGKPTNNNSLYMDYIGSPLDDHFWYVSYVVFSENYIKSSNNTYVKYYHIALIDKSNNVYFEIDVIVPADFDINKYNTLYLSILGNYLADRSNLTFGVLTVGAYVHDPLDYTLNGVAKKRYTLRYDIQMLPSAYYYFSVDLPVGYQAEATVTNKSNAIGIGDYLGGNPDNAEHTLTYDGAYLPPSSIVAQLVKVTINVTEGAASETNVWGIQSSDIYTRSAVLDNDQVVGN